MLSTGLSPVEAVELIAAAVSAQPKELQPVFLNLVTRLLCNGLDERLDVVTLEEGNLSAVLAEQQMLVTLTSRDERLTPHWLVDALDEVQLLQLFQCAIHSDQPQRTVFLPRQIVHFDGGEGMVGIDYRLHHRAASLGDTIAVLMQLGEPGFSGHSHSFCK